MTYLEAMDALTEAAYAAVHAAENQDGAPVEALKALAADVDCLTYHKCTVRDYEDAKRVYRGAKAAGWVK